MKDILNYFHSEEITNSGIIPRLASIKNLSEEKTVASNHREGGIQIENMALSKGSLVVVHFFAKTGEKSESTALKTANVPSKRPVSCKRECSNTCTFFDMKSKQRQIHKK